MTVEEFRILINKEFDWYVKYNTCRSEVGRSVMAVRDAKNSILYCPAGKRFWFISVVQADGNILVTDGNATFYTDQDAPRSKSFIDLEYVSKAPILSVVENLILYERNLSIYIEKSADRGTMYNQDGNEATICLTSHEDSLERGIDAIFDIYDIGHMIVEHRKEKAKIEITLNI
jgi:hypothetical protein